MCCSPNSSNRRSMKSDHGTRCVCVLWGGATQLRSGPVCCAIVAHHRRSSHQRVRPVTPAMLAPPLPHTTRVVGSRSRSGVLRVRVLGGCAFFGVLGPTARGLQDAGLGRGSHSAPVGCVSYLLGTQIKIRVSRTITTCAMNAKHCEWPTMAIRERSDTKAMTIPLWPLERVPSPVAPALTFLASELKSMLMTEVVRGVMALRGRTRSLSLGDSCPRR